MWATLGVALLAIVMRIDYRLYREPIRLFPRYVLGNPLFLLRMLCQSSQASQAKKTSVSSQQRWFLRINGDHRQSYAT